MRQDEKYFCETDEEEHNPKPMPTGDNKAKRIFSRRTWLFFKLINYKYSLHLKP